MQRQTRFRIVALLTLAIWTTAITQLISNAKMPSRSHLTVTLASEPKRVRIQIKGDKSLSRDYLDTPITLKMPPGRRRIRVSHPGYRGHDMTVEGAAGDQINMGLIVLERDPNVVSGFVEVKLQGKGIYYEINDRLFQSDKNSDLIELALGVEHELSATLGDPQDEASFWRCRFTIKENTRETPQTIYIRRIKGRRANSETLRLTPCDQLTPPERSPADRQQLTDPAKL